MKTMEIYENMKIKAVVFMLVVFLSLFWQHYFYNKKSSTAWITTDRYVGSLEPINISVVDIEKYSAFLASIEDADKNTHHKEAYQISSKDADALILIIKFSAKYEITPFKQMEEKTIFHFSIRIIETHQIYSVSISYQNEKPLIA